MKELEECITFWKAIEKYCSSMNESTPELAKQATGFLGEMKRIVEQTTSSLVELRQLKEKIRDLPFKTTTIGPSRSVPARTQIRFLFEDEYQDLMKAVNETSKHSSENG